MILDWWFRHMLRPARDMTDDHRRALAQLAEHRSPKPKVGGSSPSCPARSIRSSRPTTVERGRDGGVPDSKVVYPTQEQLITYFIVVMVFVVVMMTIVSLLDLGFGKLAFEVFAGGGS